jgi:hypothetical protein
MHCRVVCGTVPIFEEGFDRVSLDLKFAKLREGRRREWESEIME